ncbi:MAG TPA: valine--tRNA ligase [Candidatus Yanofskybacteria bacterium]|nr:valine--tRNA ligase [Candidatus Yanofskybacteria bacterium]HBX58722.1 valine--tRNA ligase [Candidatus Yanofskybacteria bacterium]
MSKEIVKTYEPKAVESKIYKIWEDSGFFNPDNSPAKNGGSFSMVLPPPNVTGVLHLGHALTVTIEDIIIRHQRMLGKKTLWLPGTDHAAIATQSKVEELILKKEGKNRHDLGREEFLKRVDDYAQQSHDAIITQLKHMGTSLDWSREAFTLDSHRNLAVKTAFKNMYADGLIYRGHRVINWDPKGQTTVSDEEIVYEETQGKFYTFRYSKDFPIAISTTRPETKVGDTAVAVHPDDERYKQFINKEYEIDFAGSKIKVRIIADSAADPTLGTGAVGVTPAHSIIDWEIAQRNNLALIQVIDEYGRMNENAGTLIAGKKTKEAREIVIQWLKDNDLLEKEEDVQINIARAQRSNGIIEPLPKLQWFVAVDKEFILKESKIEGIASGSKITLKRMMRHVVESGQINIIPDHFSKTYFHWIDNLRDWCISRQIWYGHRIPVWYRDHEIYVGVDAPASQDWQQDSDTLDTWFSSGLWTFSTLGWPNKTEDLSKFHPTDVLETGYDILFFWVARMILMTGYCLGEIPFKTIYLHGLIRDKDRQKMSKSKGNAIDPIEMADRYGTDALRFALIFSTAAGNDIPLAEDKIKGMKHFANKIWNISRFILTNTDSELLITDEQPKPTTAPDAAILESLNATTKSVSDSLERLMLHQAAQEIYQFAWYKLADIYIEASKTQILDSQTKTNTQKILIYCLANLLKLLHPFMPFITEEIYSSLPITNKKLLLVENWPA